MYESCCLVVVGLDLDVYFYVNEVFYEVFYCVSYNGFLID